MCVCVRVRVRVRVRACVRACVRVFECATYVTCCIYGQRKKSIKSTMNEPVVISLTYRFDVTMFQSPLSFKGSQLKCKYSKKSFTSVHKVFVYNPTLV